MRRFFNILLGALAMIAVALLSAFLTMRLVIHGREVEVPNVAGLTVAEANNLVSGIGLNMNLENHFYSTVTPAGRILSQYPAAGTKVRREWVLRVTESIGPQKVSVPNVVGQTEREASVTIRRLSLDLGAVAYIPAPGPPGIVLSQTPTPAAAGVDGPRISLLVSEPFPVVRTRQPASEASPDPPDTLTDAASSPPAPDVVSPAPDAASAPSATPAATSDQPETYAMPTLIGLPLSLATARLAAIGLRITSMETSTVPIRPVAPVASPKTTGAPASAADRPIAPLAPLTLPNTVISQSPAIGHRVTKADVIHIVVTR